MSVVLYGRITSEVFDYIYFISIDSDNGYSRSQTAKKRSR